jgi:hypothetical protein
MWLLSTFGNWITAHAVSMHSALSYCHLFQLNLGSKALISRFFFPVDQWPKETATSLPHGTPENKNFPSAFDTEWHNAGFDRGENVPGP